MKQSNVLLSGILAVLSVGAISLEAGEWAKGGPGKHNAGLTDLKKETEARTPQSLLKAPQRAFTPQQSASAPATPFHIYVMGNDDAGVKSGVYTLTCGETPQLTHVNSDAYIYGGAVYVGGKLHYISHYTFMGNTNATYHIRNLEEMWNQEYEERCPVSSVAMDMTYDPVSCKVYGCFTNDTKSAYNRFCTFDLTDGSTSQITELPTAMYVMAASPAGELFGISPSGALYRIDKSNGETKKVGETGIVLSQDYSSGTFCSEDGRFYFINSISQNGASETTLYTVDTTDATVQSICTLPASTLVTTLLDIPPLADRDAPTAPDIESSTLNFTAGSLTGDIRFTLPATSFAGTPLTGSLGYTVYLNGKEAASGQGTAGSTVATKITAEAPGMYSVKISASNSAGRSPLSQKKELWIGNDAPAQPADIRIEHGASANIIHLEWNAPASGAHEGYIDPDRITYSVVRMPDEKEIASGTTATSIDDMIPEGTVSSYWYRITPWHADIQGITAESPKLTIGNPLELPWREDFADQSGFDLFTVIDANNDGKTWNLYESQQAARISFGWKAMDDWLVTPPLNLKSGMTYRVYADIKVEGSAPASFNMAMGPGSSAESLTSELIPATTVGNQEYQTFEKSFTVDSDGIYHIGIHATSPKETYRMLVDCIGVENAMMKCPGVVTDLKATAGEKGRLEATLSFTTPDVTASGAELTELTSIEIYSGSDNTLIGTVANPGIGQPATYTDSNALPGENSYTVVAVNSSGAGFGAKTSVYVGYDVPEAPVNVVLREDGQNAVLSWDPSPKDIRGMEIDESALTYSVQRATDGIWVAREISERTLTDTPPINGIQGVMAYWVYAHTTAGMSERCWSNIITMGSPYQLPFKESFPNGKISMRPWAIDESGKGTWNVVSHGTNPDIEPCDNDRGMVSFMPKAAGEKGLLTSPKISLKGTSNPALEFYCCGSASDLLLVMVSADGGEFSQGEEIALDSADGKWTKCSISLAEYLDSEYIQVRFFARSYNGKSNLHLDDIRVKDNIPYDLTAGALSTPYRMDYGVSGSVDFTVINNGNDTAEGFSIRLWRNGEVCQTMEPAPLPSGMETTYTFTETPDMSFDETTDYRCDILFANDGNPADNKSDSRWVEVRLPQLDPVTDLTGEYRDGSVCLAWKAPVAEDTEVLPLTEDFEVYDPFIIDRIGDWTMADVDGSEGTLGIADANGKDLYFTHTGEPMAWQVFNPAEAGMVDPSGTWTPYSGNQMLVAWTDIDQKNDNWLISPMLYQGAQRISFFVKSPSDKYGLETYEVLYSSTGKEIQEFIKIQDGEAPTRWSEVKVDLPADARYFAIRNTSEGKWAMMLDDITCTPHYAAPVPVTLTGYKVYLEKEPLAQTTADMTEFQMKSDGGLFAVSAVYDKGESRLSDEIMVTESDVADTLSALPEAFGGHGRITVLNACGLGLRITTSDGMTLFDGVSDSDSCTIDATPGIYIVSVGDFRFKVIVG